MILSNNNLLSNSKKEIIKNNFNIYNVGDIISFAGTKIPENWFIADGSYIDKDTYSELYNIIGTTWGTLSGNNFPLPNLKGLYLRGRDRSQSRDKRINLRTNGDNVGSLLLNSLTGLPTISFSGTSDDSDPSTHRHDKGYVNGLFSGNQTSTAFANRVSGTYATYTTNTDNNNHGHNISPTTGTSTMTGGDTETSPISYYMEFIIKYI